MGKANGARFDCTAAMQKLIDGERVKTVAFHMHVSPAVFGFHMRVYMRQLGAKTILQAAVIFDRLSNKSQRT